MCACNSAVNNTQNQTSAQTQAAAADLSTQAGRDTVIKSTQNAIANAGR